MMRTVKSCFTRPFFFGRTFLSSALGSTLEQQPKHCSKVRIVSSVCVQRFPLVTPVKTLLEQRYHHLQSSIRLRRSRLSDFEIEEKSYWDKKMAREKKAQEEDLDSTEVAEMEKEAIFEELQESRSAELQLFQTTSTPSSVGVEDLKSSSRKVEEMLYLLVKKPRDEFCWQFPQGSVDTDESLIEAAMRELHEECGESLNVNFLSNSPFAHHTYKDITTKKQTKVFFFKAHYNGGSIKLNANELQDFVWVTKHEMREYVSKDYYNAVSPSLLT